MASPSLDCATTSFKFIPREGSEHPGISYVYEINADDERRLAPLVKASKVYQKAKAWLETNRVDFAETFFQISDEEDISACIAHLLPTEDIEARSMVEQLRSSYQTQRVHYSCLKKGEVGCPHEGVPFLRPHVEQEVEFQPAGPALDTRTSRYVVIKVGEEWDFTSDFFVSKNYSESFGSLDRCRVAVLEEEKGYSLFLTRPTVDGLETYREQLKEPHDSSFQLRPFHPGSASGVVERAGFPGKAKVSIGHRKESLWSIPVKKHADSEGE